MSAPTQNSRLPVIFDRELVAKRLSVRQSNKPDFVMQLVQDDLADRLLPITRAFSKALIMGPIADMLPENGISGAGAFSYRRVSTLSPGPDKIDPENLTLETQDYDLIVSLLDLQIVNDVPGFLARIRHHLAPDGLMLLAAIGGNSLGELRAAWLAADAEISGGAYARIAPFIDVRDAGSLLQRTGFALPVTDIEQHMVRYSSPLALMKELRELGASNPLAQRPEKPVTKRLLAAANTHYQDMAGDPDGRIRVNLEIVWMSGWAPHESQQKPLAPGSAKTSLASALADRSDKSD